jgi:hypothetical protein
LETLLAEIRINDEQYFTLAERNKAFENELLKEIKRGRDGFNDPATVSKLGKMVGAQGIYIGTVTVSKCSDTPKTEERSKCFRYEKVKDKKGNIEDGDCIDLRIAKVNCTSRVAKFTAFPKLVDVEAGIIRYSKKLDAEAASYGCTDNNYLATPEQLSRKARDAAFVDLRKDVAPSTTDIQLAVFSSDAGIVGDEAKKKYKSAVAFGKVGQMERACELWNEVAVEEKASPGTIFGLGLCAEVAGELDKALTLYTSANRLLDKPDDSVGMALVRVRETQARQKKLDKQASKEEVSPQQKKKK